MGSVCESPCGLGRKRPSPGSRVIFGIQNLRCVSILTLFQASSMLLFQAAYFWLKFRDILLPSSSKRKLSEGFDGNGRGVYARPLKDRDGNVKGYKYEPRFKPPRERNGPTVQTFNHLPLGSYSDPQDAQIVRNIAAFYYGVGSETVSLRQGGLFQIPAMANACLSGLAKAKWVAEKVKEVFELYCRRNNATSSSQPPDEDVNEGGAAIQTADPSPDNTLNFNWTSSPEHTECGDVQERLSPYQPTLESLHDALEDPEEFLQLEPGATDCSYFQLEQSHFLPNLDMYSTPSNSFLPDQAEQFLSNGAQLQRSDASTHEVVGARVQENSGRCFNDFEQPIGASSPILTSFCDKDCATELLVEVVSMQQRQIRALKREVELRKREAELLKREVERLNREVERLNV